MASKSVKKGTYVKNGKGVGHRYPKEYKQRVIDWVARRSKRGDSISAVSSASRHFEIPYQTIRLWCGGVGERARPSVDKTALLKNVQKDFVKATKVFQQIARMIG